ncbi:UNVERIFIED_CONTAM: hypothetical protein Sangu_3195500 [Sesamum angustifolium]|uniref:Uncharacterized protein n=1 Tax=Sesamum angustifolium TaxID=2727405 RepID=A0AAW2JNA5_9LAMI
MKGSLAIVRNAMQPKLQLAFIEFSEYSGSRESSSEYGDGEFGMSDERALSPLALKTKIQDNMINDFMLLQYGYETNSAVGKAEKTFC